MFITSPSQWEMYICSFVLCLLYFSCLCSAHARATKDQCVLANPLWSMFVELTGLCLVLFGQPPFHFPVSLCQIIFLLLALFHTFFPYFGLICSCVCFLFGWSSFSQREPAWLIHAHSISCPSCLFFFFSLFFAYSQSSSDDYVFIERRIYFAMESIPSYFCL